MIPVRRRARGLHRTPPSTSARPAPAVSKVSTFVPGLRVRSAADARIANFLYSKGFEFMYIPRDGAFRPCFHLPGLGVVLDVASRDLPEQGSRVRAHLDAYRDAGFRVITVDAGADAARMEDALTRAFEALPAPG